MGVKSGSVSLELNDDGLRSSLALKKHIAPMSVNCHKHRLETMLLTDAASIYHDVLHVANCSNGRRLAYWKKVFHSKSLDREWKSFTLCPL